MRKSAFAIACIVALVLAAVAPAGLPAPLSPSIALVGAFDAIEESFAKPAREPEAHNQDDGVETDGAYPTLNGFEYEPSAVLVGVAKDATLEQVNERLGQLDYIATSSLSEDDLVYGYARLSLADGISVQSSIERLMREPFVDDAAPNIIMHALEDAEPPDETLQAGEVNLDDNPEDDHAETIDDPRAKEQWALSAVRAFEAWKLAKTQHKATVAVLDSGLNMSHEDLKDNVVGSYNVFDKTSDVNDTYGHGTHVAGIAAATANNAAGIAGVSYNAGLLPVKIMTDKDADLFNTLAGVQYVIEYAEQNPDANVRAMNLSIGTAPVTDEEYATFEALPSVKTFLSALKSADDAGITVVFASGNSGAGGAYKCFPCDSATESIGVINAWRNGEAFERSKDSNYNIPNSTAKELCAPGDDRKSSQWILSTSKSGSYDRMHGTSMAAPCVSGIVALVCAANLELTSDQVKQLLCDTAQDLGEPGFDLETGFGMVDAYAAVKRAKKPQPDPPAPAPAVSLEMHRLYNPNSGEHFYTSDVEERNALVALGWRYEGVGWLAPESSNSPVYRLYNKYVGDHHYTTSTDERDSLVDVEWIYEGIGWYSDDGEGRPLFRQYNPNATTGMHNYTTSKDENDWLVSLGWKAEGIGWYGLAE